MILAYLYSVNIQNNDSRELVFLIDKEVLRNLQNHPKRGTHMVHRMIGSKVFKIF